VGQIRRPRTFGQDGSIQGPESPVWTVRPRIGPMCTPPWPPHARRRSRSTGSRPQAGPNGRVAHTCQSSGPGGAADPGWRTTVTGPPASAPSPRGTVPGHNVSGEHHSGGGTRAQRRASRPRRRRAPERALKVRKRGAQAPTRASASCAGRAMRPRRSTPPGERWTGREASAAITTNRALR